MIMQARLIAGWITEADLAKPRKPLKKLLKINRFKERSC